MTITVTWLELDERGLLRESLEILGYKEKWDREDVWGDDLKRTVRPLWPMILIMDYVFRPETLKGKSVDRYVKAIPAYLEMNSFTFTEAQARTIGLLQGTEPQKEGSFRRLWTFVRRYILKRRKG